MTSNEGFRDIRDGGTEFGSSAANDEAYADGACIDTSTGFIAFDAERPKSKLRLIDPG